MNFDADDTYEFTARGLTRIHLSGDFGGGTLNVRTSPEGVWKTIQNGAFTADADEQFYFGHGEDIQLQLTGSTNPDLDFYVQAVNP